ncbi:MAG: type II toxin-antitoxin system RelE/ParE family toxin [Chloroflexi bacterium]|nr:type II toxin-antitoxin system RelE/ParE family toxin [Chloroflexota bacterium]
MSYRLGISSSAEREMRALSKDILQRIHQRISRLQEQPFAAGTRKLAGGSGYRVRVGDYRIIYVVDQADPAVTIVHVRHRREAYR